MDTHVTIGFAGNVILDESFDKIIAEKGYDYPWGNMLAELRNADINIINLETALTNSTRRVCKSLNFKISPDKVRSLVNANISVTNIANGHIFDFANNGFQETIETLDAVAISHVGAGKNILQAIEPLLIQRKGITIGVIGVTDVMPAWKANGRPGINYIDFNNIDDRLQVYRAVERLRREADIVIASIHSTQNTAEEPSLQFVSFAQGLSQHGAHIIYGHAAGAIQGIEYYNNSLILYNAGDFTGGHTTHCDNRNGPGAFFLVTVDQSGLCKLEIIPTHHSHWQVNHASQNESKLFIRKMQRLSAVFNTRIDDDGKTIFTRALQSRYLLKENHHQHAGQKIRQYV